ncbi:MAG: DNA polymerase III subunit beta [Alphaproteobacteria bacterium]|nr:DNA polymerase III subunit beta [Alphaproteobacteria bacterium]
MKLTVEKGPFLKALSHGQSVVEKRTTVPILSHVLVSASAEGLSLTSTDMDMALIETIPAQVEESSTTCVQAHLLHEVVRKLSDRTPISLVVDHEKGHMVITSGRSRFELPCLDPTDFPQITQSELSHYFPLPAPVLKLLIDKTKFSMSGEEARFHLNGIHFHQLKSDDGREILRTVATDMHRLACVDCDSPEAAIGMPGVIVGRKTITEVRKLLDEANKPITVGLSNARIEFAIEGDGTRSVLSSRLVDGTFPDYQGAITVENDKSLIVHTKAFAEAVDRVGTVVNDKVRAIKARVTENQVLISAVSNELGSATEELDVDFAYEEPIEVCFNVRYLMDIAQQIETEEMEILLADGDSLALIRAAGKNAAENNNATFVLMPMRV